MSESKQNDKLESTFQEAFGGSISRKSFLKYAGVSAAAAATFGLVGCSDDSTGPGTGGGGGGGGTTVMLGSGDIGVLNFAYALEQLEAAFYAKVVSSFYSGATEEEKTILNDIAAHEAIHRDFLKAALGDAAIPGLTPQFETAGVDFSSRDSVLNTASALEETGVGAYNGAGPVLKDKGYLLLAGKIVSVEARHAAAVNDLLAPGTAAFAPDLQGDAKNSFGIDPNGLDNSFSIEVVLSKAGGFIEETLDVSQVGK